MKSSAGKNKGNGSTGHGNRYLARVLGETAGTASRTDTFLGARYRRISRRRGKKKASVAIGRSQLVIIWHLLTDPTPSSTTSEPTTTTGTFPQMPNAATTSTPSKPSATTSPSNPQPDP